MSTLALLDEAAVDRLREWGGSALVARMIDLFIELGPERLSQIRSGSANGEPETVERAAHSLKSSAANLGAERLRARAAELEEAAMARRSGEIEPLVASLVNTYETTVTELRRLRPDVDPPEEP